jgi:hypothetical protein
MDVKRALCAFLIVSLLAACTTGSLAWQKPGATQEAVDADLQSCRLAAQDISALSSPQTAPQSQSTAVRGTSGERDVAEAQLLQQCMQKRGYRLEPK